MIAQSDAPIRFSRTMLVGALVATMAVFTFGGLPTAAHAAGTPIGGEGSLAAALSTSGVDPTVTLGTTFNLVTSSLLVERTVTLDLAGHTLYANNVHLNTGVTLTITDSSGASGALMAVAEVSGLAGITTTGATLIVNRGDIVALGRDGAAGIGGDAGGDGGEVIIGAAARVFAAATGTTSAVGAGDGGTSFGTFEVNGSFTLQSAELTVPAGATISGAGTITSWNHITNNGTILPTIAGNGNVSGNDFLIGLAENYPGNGGYAAYHLYAPTFQAAGIALPAPDRGPLVSLTKWTSEPDGTGTTFTDTTSLTGLSGALFFAQWTASGVSAITIDYEGSPAPAQAGRIGLTAVYSVGGATWDIADLVAFRSDVADDDIDQGYYGAGLYGRTVGPRIVTGSLMSDPDVTGSVQVSVMHSEGIDEIALSMTPTTILSGRSSTAYLGAADEFGNSFGDNILLDNPCDWCELELESSDPTDVIDLVTGRITMTTLGTHTITITLDMGEGGFRQVDAIVTVVPGPTSLAATGHQPDEALWLGGLLLLLGLALVGRRRRAEDRSFGSRRR